MIRSSLQPCPATTDRRTNSPKRSRQKLADANLKAGALMGLPFPDEKKQAENNARVEKLIELALDLSPGEPPIIQSVLGGGKWEEKKYLFRDCLGVWTEMASLAGVKLAIKPHRGHAMTLPKEGIWLIEQLNAKDKLSLVYDQSHYAWRDLDVSATVAEALPYTGYLVMKDVVRSDDGKVRFALPGAAGTIPHAEILRQFIEAGYRGEICAEVSSQVWKQDGYDPAEATRACFTNLSQIVSDASEEGFTPIFNGKDLSDWDGKPGCWEVRDGEIWCTGVAKEKNWLIWRKDQPADFVLRLDFRWDKGNSGVQVRSDDLGEWQIFGYQVEVASQEKMGLWHHSLLEKDHPKKKERHLMATAGQETTLAADGSKAVEQLHDPKATQANFKEHAWNTMEIIAQGPKLTQKINGTTYATVIDNDSEMSRKKGFIALQDHGKGCIVAFRDLRLKKL
ncbi:MAG: DUF1080 domain-containing protein [Verrucomicrobiales bacterium]|nr:DUF1080 domain-containing protein [Verrucomicrobiales bacterium]